MTETPENESENVVPEPETIVEHVKITEEAPEEASDIDPNTIVADEELNEETFFT